MTVKDIIIEKIKQIGADGLCNIESDCGCGLDDLMPCNDQFIYDCEPAIKKDDGLFYAMDTSLHELSKRTHEPT
jgi:hypothetical protein